MKCVNTFIVLGLILSLANFTWAADTHNGKEATQARQEFESRCPRPQWWDRVSVSDVNIVTYDDLLKYWQNKDRSKSQFFKAAYQAILDYLLHDDIVVNAIKFMNYTYSYPYRIELQEYAIEKYFSYKGPYGRWGDSIAGIVRNLGQLYNDAGQYGKSIDLIERFLKEREKETNDHLLELMHLTYAEALHGQNRTAEAVQALKGAVEKYNGSWEKRLSKAIAKYEGRETTASSRPSAPTGRLPKQEKPWWKNNILIIGGLLLVFLLILVLRSWSQQETKFSATYSHGSLGTDYDVEQLVMQGHKIQAIKLCRKIHNVGLKEAKDTVDRIAKKIGMD